MNLASRIIAIAVFSVATTSCQSIFESQECKRAKADFDQLDRSIDEAEYAYNKSRALHEASKEEYIPGDTTSEGLDKIIKNVEGADSMIQSLSKQTTLLTEQVVVGKLVKKFCGYQPE